MSSLAERAGSLDPRLGVQRLELSRGGELLLELRSDPEPSWARTVDSGVQRLRIEDDDLLPLATRLPDLRRERSARVLAWRPGRRAVVRVDGAVLKAFRDRRLGHSLECHDEGARAALAAGLVAAEVRAVDERLASFELRDLGGRPVPVTRDTAPRFGQLGAALARFQRVERAAGGLQRHAVADELAVLDSLAGKARKLCGGLPAGWEAARLEVQLGLERVGEGAYVRTHRDLHDGQLLECEDGLALLDFDLLCEADEALDPANLLAHLELRALQGLADDGAASACASAFRAGFGRCTERELVRRLQAWEATALTRLALVYHLRPPYSHLGASLVASARTRVLEILS